MAYPFPKYGDPDYYAASVMTEIFGGGMSSRLFREVREKRGLVYSVSSMYAPNGIFGAGYIYAGTTPEKAHETVQVTLDQMRAMQSEGVTADELERAKVQLKSELVMRGESSAARMGALARAWWFEGRLIPISEITEAVDAVSQEQILGLLQALPADLAAGDRRDRPAHGRRTDRRRAHRPLRIRSAFAGLKSRRTVGGDKVPIRRIEGL